MKLLYTPTIIVLHKNIKHYAELEIWYIIQRLF